VFDQLVLPAAQNSETVAWGLPEQRGKDLDRNRSGCWTEAVCADNLPSGGARRAGKDKRALQELRSGAEQAGHDGEELDFDDHGQLRAEQGHAAQTT